MNWEKVRTAVLSGMLAVSLAAAGPSELLMMGNGGTVVHAEESREESMIDQSLMTASADSYESGNEPYQALDGENGTWWHTSWSNRKDLPQSITLTLQEPVDGICQLQYMPRTDKDWNGTILEYKISVSTDGETFTDTAAGTWEATKDKKTATFDSVNQVKAVKLTGITSKGNRESDDSMYVSAAEIRLVCRDSFVKNKEPLEELMEKGKRLTADSQEGKQAILKQLLEETQEALANPLTVQERLDKLVSELKTVVEPRTSFTGYAGERLFDTNGERIQAHGGQISKWGDTWYWYGEDKTDGWYPRGVHLYTSKDLYNWEDQGVVLKTMKNIEEIDTDPYFHALYGNLSTEERQEVFRHIDYNSSVVERPKVLYNQTTGKYVLWFHADGPDGESSESYAKAMAGVAIADRPEGPFRFLKAKRLDCSQDYSGSNRGMARDMNLFQDDDGTAYIIYASEENATLYISRLNAAYTDLDVQEGAVEGRDFTRNMVNSSREAPAMFKYQGKYYLMTSGCTGWDPNAAIYYTADSPLGPWTAKGNPCVGEEKDTTFRTQSTCIFPVDAKNGKFLYMGDRWNRNDLADSRYVWLPVELGYSGEMKISASSDWAVEDLKEAAFVSLYQKDTVYFVDCNKETSGFFDGFAERKIELLNQTGDQKYDGVWGLTGEPGDYNGDILFGSGYWAKANESIVYRFTLPAGRYQAAAGFREWWSENRQAMLNVKLVENPDTEQEELRSLAEEVPMNTTKDDQNSIFQTAFTLENSGMVEISVDKAGGGDPLLAWMGIVKEAGSEEEPDEAVEAVIEKIQAIGTVTLESKAAIDEARNAYDALTDAQKELVKNLNVLERAEEEYGNLKKAEEEQQADEKAAAAVIEKIEAIGTVTPESKDIIDEARNAYEALTDTQKKLVTNLALLEAAEAAYEKLETPDTETPGTETPGTEEPGTEKPDDPTQPKKELKKGGVYKAGKLYYKVLSTAKREVAVLKPVKKTEKSITIPGNVKLEGISCTVTQIAKNAFWKNKKLTKVTIGKNVQVIGKNAFNGAKKLKKMIIKSKKLKKAYASSIRGISKKAVIQAPKAKKKAYTKLFQIRGKSGVKVK